MKKVIGLDISSSTIGWALLSFDDSKNIRLDDYGHIKPPASSKGTLSYRVSSAYDLCKNLLVNINPDYVAVEAYANKFSHGRSSARTIIVLSVFNEMICMASLRALEKEPFRYAVSTIRSSISNFLDKKMVSKDDNLDLIKGYFNNFKVSLNRNNKIKKESYDEADAISVALCHIIKLES